MKYLHKSYVYLSLAVAVLNLVIFIGVYAYLPEQVPLHWNIRGEVDNYGSKLYLWIFALLPLIMISLMMFLPRFDPRRESYAKHVKAYSVFLLSITLFFCILFQVVLAMTFEWKVKFHLVIQLLLGVFLMGIGNVMGQIRHNYFFGVRTPWTLSSEQNWRKTHRFAARVMVFVGFVFFVCAWLSFWYSFVISFGMLLVGIIAIYLYSYWEFRKYL